MPSNSMVEIKICGINDLAAMEAALAGGADLVGLVFFRASPRALTYDAALKLAEQARGRARIVALTVDAPDEELARVVETINPDLLQLHGEESPTRIAEIRARFGRPVMKAIRVAAPDDLAAVPTFAAVADWLLFDARPPRDATRPGGHGRAFDWALLSRVERTKPVMLSGGLDATNVAVAIRTVRPDAVDVSSGVERAPGMKDPEKILAFVAAARAAAATLTVKRAKEKAS
jgi:phosphoribosylanthranilate isomerase